MLVLSRMENESILIGPTIVTVLSVHGRRAKIGVQAPKEIKVLRGEIVDDSSNLLPPEDQHRKSIVSRLRKMSPDKRERIIRWIIQEFCAPKEVQIA